MTAKRELLLIRHAESQVNVDIAVPAYAQAQLTGHGHEQARRLGESWPPDLRVAGISPFRVARETAGYLSVGEAVASLPDSTLSEFRYLNSAFADGSNRGQRQARGRAYWDRADPYFRDGGDAESFIGLMTRVRQVLSNPAYHGNAVITHGMFIVAATILSEYPEMPINDSFGLFRTRVRGGSIPPNCTIVRVNHIDCQGLREYSG